MLKMWLKKLSFKLYLIKEYFMGFWGFWKKSRKRCVLKLLMQLIFTKSFDFFITLISRCIKFTIKFLQSIKPNQWETLKPFEHILKPLDNSKGNILKYFSILTFKDFQTILDKFSSSLPCIPKMFLIGFTCKFDPSQEENFLFTNYDKKNC